MVPAYKMLLCCQILLMTIVMLSWEFRISTPSPIHSEAKATAFSPGPVNKSELSLPTRLLPRRNGKMPAASKADIKSRGVAPPGHIAFQFLHRGPAYEIIPIRIGALALHTFYTSIAHSAATIWPQTEYPAMVLTITQGALQLTMSGIGTAVPWDFVEDWAMRAAESVVRGWTDTFDAGYEVEGMGMGVWISLRLLEGWVGDGDAMSMSQ